MRTTASIVAEALGELDRQFRLEGGVFAIFLPQISKIKAIEKANTLRNSVADSEKYIVPTTVSMGVFYSDEITSPQEKDIVLLKQIVTQTARFRLRLAKREAGILLSMIQVRQSVQNQRSQFYLSMNRVFKGISSKEIWSDKSIRLLR